MATYVPNAFDKTQPTEDKFVESAALEFRTVKDPVIRSLRFPDVDDVEGNMGEMPDAASRAGRLLAFDPLTGKPTAVSALGGSNPVSVFGSQLIMAADAASARDILQVPYRNDIINGGMLLSQRALSIAAIPNGAYFVDRFCWTATTTAVVTASQSTDVRAGSGLSNSARITVTTADAAVAAGDEAKIRTILEGYTVRKYVGRTFTIGFDFISPKAGVHCISLKNGAATRTFVAEFTMNAANTWERKYITIPGGLPNSGVWDFVNGAGLRVDWALMAGTTYHTAAGAWQVGNFVSTAAQVNCLDTPGNIIGLAGVALYPGAAQSEFMHDDLAAEVIRAQRYFAKTYPLATPPGAAAFYVGARMTGRTPNTAVQSAIYTWQLPQQMRAAANMVAYNPETGGTGTWREISGASNLAVSIVYPSTDSAVLYNNAAIPSGGLMVGHLTADAELT